MGSSDSSNSCQIDRIHILLYMHWLSFPLIYNDQPQFKTMPNNNEYNREQSNERNPSNGCTFLKLVSIWFHNPEFCLLFCKPIFRTRQSNFKCDFSITSPSSLHHLFYRLPHQHHINTTSKPYISHLFKRPG